MSNRPVFQLRLTEEEAQRLEDQAAEKGLSKADLIRTALGWPRSHRRGPRRATPVVPSTPPEQQIDPERQPGASAIQQLAARLGRKSL